MLCYSTGSLPDGIPFAEIADILAPTPFTGVELVVTAPMLARADDTRHWEDLRDSFMKRGLAFRNVHLGAPHLLGPDAHRPGLSSLAPAERSVRIEATVKSMVIAKALGCPHLTLTTGLTESEPGRAAQEQAFRGALAEIVRRKPRSLKILIEQEPEHVINSAAQLLSLGRAFPGEVYANFDVGHSEVVGEDIAAAIRALGPLLRNVHLEDIKGRVHRHHLYGDGDVDFAAIFQALHDIGYRGDYTPDLYPFKDAYGPALEASETFLRKHGVLTPAL
ncbi:MAG: Xylose isomerase domain protein barrel [Fibrobacteres bacterium]|nr:Xylose isomerase domain protein barrel [Fibrobacterota bacterium]